MTGPTQSRTDPMTRRGSQGTTRFRIDATRCDGQGVCALIAPELFALDRYGLAYVVPGSEELLDADDDVRQRGRDADAMCPRNAIHEHAVVGSPVAPAPSLPPAPVRSRTPGAGGAGSGSPARLLLDAPQSVVGWQEAGGWADAEPERIIGDIERAGLVGQGGAAFPVAAKWRRLAAGRSPIVVVNGAEREPGTVKDHYLMGDRPGLVLDGLRLIMAATGSAEAIIAVDEEADGPREALAAAIDQAAEAGLIDRLAVRIERVPARYVAGEETALISVIDGGLPLPRLRPPFPSEIGVAGRPTIVHNVETVAQVALAVTLGGDEFTSVGSPEAPGTGLFSVSQFGGPVTLVERPYGTPLREVLGGAGSLEGARAVLVGGYAGGLIPVAQLDVPLAPGPLRRLGLTLGTKSLQVVGPTSCPVRVAADITGYFAAETAGQCPPCTRGLPDMAAAIEGLVSGRTGPDELGQLEEFLSTLAGRGVCRLPDGAGRLITSLLAGFADEVAAHVGTGCSKAH